MSARTRILAVLADKAVSLPVAAYLMGARLSTVYERCRDGAIPLAPPSLKGHRRIALDTLAAMGVDVSPERVIEAERLFSFDIAVRTARRATVEQSA
jgi:hypothetical protein